MSADPIERTVRALPAIAGLQEMWSRRTAEGESEQDHWALLDWLDKGAKRGAPTNTQAAARYQWAERAAAYDRAWELAKDAERGGSALTPEQMTVENLTTVVQLESKKLLRAAATEVGAVLSPKDLLAIIGTLKELQLTSIKAQRAAPDLSKYSDEELKIMRKANEICRSKQNK